MAAPTLPTPPRELAGLTDAELARYARHVSLKEIGEEGQRRLKTARVLVVGAGGLGSPASMYLAAAGVGTLGVVDFDRVDRSNLHRQILYGESNVGDRKLDAARARLADINPHVEIVAYEERLSASNAERIVSDYDVVVDGTDNFATRYLVNDVCVLLGKPNVYGSILRFEGQLSVFATENGPCYRCLFREPPPPGLIPSCGEAGVLGVLPGIIGSLQANETIKLITGAGEPMIGRLLLFDALDTSFRSIEVRRDPACPACGTREITLLKDYDEYCAPRTANREQVPGEIMPEELRDRLARGDRITLLDVREPHEWRIARIEGARLIPLRELEYELDTLSHDSDIVTYCHHGMRSRAAAEQLVEAGFRVSNLSGGIDRWSREIDPTVQRY